MRILVTVTLIPCLISFAFAAAPTVSNIEAKQIEAEGVLSPIVEITYDVENPEENAVFIRVQVSDDRGATFSVPVTSVTGDVGPGVMPGVEKRIEWNAGTNLPNAFGTEFVVKILASNRVISNGDIIAFSNEEIVALNPDNTEIQETLVSLTNRFTWEENLVALRPGDDEVAYATRPSFDEYSINTVRVSGGLATEVITGIPNLTLLSWSRDGSMLAYVHNSSSSFSDDDGSNVTIVSATSLQEIATFELEGGYINWSPDSASLLVSGRNSDRVVELVDLQGERLVELPIQGRRASYSPDGIRIVYVGNFGDELRLSRADGSFRQLLAEDLDTVTEIVWSPEGNTILFRQGLVFSNPTVWRISTDGAGFIVEVPIPTEDIGFRRLPLRIAGWLNRVE